MEAMTFNEYQKEAMRTASGVCAATSENLILNGVMGLNGEAGEAIDMVKKATFQGHELDYLHLAKELGDILWYIAVTAQGIGYDLETIMQMNVEKLRSRYPDGFEAEKSMHRKDGDI
jgi:NTP pyrophosphatase (non-canonical NTP hydrolase)